MTENTSLAKYTNAKNKEENVTISFYLELVKKQDKKEIAEFVYQRLYTRYLKPFMFDDKTQTKQYLNGFSIMANCCLLIETIESFKNGWGDTKKKPEQAFLQFFSSDKNFTEFRDLGKEFYQNVRCGILHQGETTSGYKINRLGNKLFDNTTKTIDAIMFAKKMEKSISDYKNQLIEEEWDSEIWDNFRVKMRKIIKNCEVR